MDRCWGITILAFLLNLGSLIWAGYLVNKTKSAYDINYDDSNYDTDATIYGNKLITNVIASSVMGAALINIIGSAFVFHGFHAKNLCSLVWYIVLNSIAISTQISAVFGGLALDNSYYSNTYTYYYNGSYSHSGSTISASDMNPNNLCYFTLVVIFFNLVATVMVGKRRNETRNKKIATKFAAGSPQVVMVPGATTTIVTQQTTGQNQSQYPQQFPVQQYYMPQHVQQQGNPPAYSSAPGPGQYYGTSNPAFVENAKPMGY